MLGQVGNVRFGQLDLHQLSPLAWLQLCSNMLRRDCYLPWELSIVYYILLLVAACDQIQFRTPHLALHYLTNVHILITLQENPDDWLWLYPTKLYLVFSKTYILRNFRLQEKHILVLLVTLSGLVHSVLCIRNMVNLPLC